MMSVLLKHFIASLTVAGAAFANSGIAAEPSAPQPPPRSRGDKIDQLAFARLEAKDLASAAYTFKSIYEEAAATARTGVVDLNICQKNFQTEMRDLAGLRASFVENLETQEKLEGLKPSEKTQTLAGFDSIVQGVVENIAIVQGRCPKLDLGT